MALNRVSAGTVFSTSPDKEAEAKEFGAHHFQVWENVDEMKKANGSQDLIVNTASSDINWETALNLVGNNGTLCLVGLPTSSITIPVASLVFGQKSIAGSIVGGRRFMREMLDFSAVHNITPMVETMPLSQVNEAMDKVAANKARYRIVLTA